MPFRVHTVLKVSGAGRIVGWPHKAHWKRMAYIEYRSSPGGLLRILKCRVSALCFSKSSEESRTFAG